MADGLLRVRIGRGDFRLHDTATAADQARGLSVVDRLAEDEGMLFRLGSPGSQGMWMKDMRFAIDILWVGAEGTVVHVESGVTPESFPTVFTNPHDRPAVAVIELAAGALQRNGIAIGSPVQFASLTSPAPPHSAVVGSTG